MKYVCAGLNELLMLSVLLCCWLHDRKGIWPVQSLLHNFLLGDPE